MRIGINMDNIISDCKKNYNLVPKSDKYKVILDTDTIMKQMINLRYHT